MKVLPLKPEVAVASRQIISPWATPAFGVEIRPQGNGRVA